MSYKAEVPWPELRPLCHSDRFRAPDFDSGAQAFLEEVNENELD